MLKFARMGSYIYYFYSCTSYQRSIFRVWNFLLSHKLSARTDNSTYLDCTKTTFTGLLDVLKDTMILTSIIKILGFYVRKNHVQPAIYYTGKVREDTVR